MGNILEDNYSVFLGLYTALARTRSSAQNTYYKVLEAQKQYFKTNSESEFTEDQEKTIELLDEAMHKFYLGAFALEQLWSVCHYLEIADRGMPESYNSSMTNRQNEIVFLLSALLDQALYSWRSFLDFYLKYLLFFITGEYVPKMSIKDYRKKIAKYIEQNPNDQKAIQIEKYIITKVLCKTLGGDGICWGDFLRSLRDKTTHQKLIKPTIVEKENQQGFVITWPTIGGHNYSELAQWEFENNAFEMIRDLFPILYDLDWVAGLYKAGMYAKKSK